MDSEENSTTTQSKKNYQQLNQDYLQKIRQKKQKEQQQRILQQKKQQQKRQRLKRKILAQASKNRQNVQKPQIDIGIHQLSKTGQRRRTNIQSLPKIQQSDSKQADNESKKDYKQRYMNFLKNLNQAVKSKKEIQQIDKKKKEQKYAKLKEQLGFTNIQSKLAIKIQKPRTGDQLARSHSAQKFQSLMQKIQDEMPKTNKNFKKRNQQHLQKIKQRRLLQQQTKQQQKIRKDKLKNNLKQFVMTTVKKNVLEGVYDQQVEKLEKKKSKKEKIKQKNTEMNDEDEQKQDEQNQQSSQQDEENKMRRKLRSFPYVTDLAEWKKKNRIQPTDKVYIVTGGYGQLKKALKQRGWYSNPDSRSPCFDLKYTLQGKQINYDNLQDFQLVNHFQKAGCLTTKVGLTKSLRNLKYIKDISQDNFFPKCFDLNDQDDYVGFQNHFKICKALSILKIYTNFFHGASVSNQARQKNKQLIEDLKLRTEVALSVCKKNIQDIDQIIDKKKTTKVVTDKQWQILAQDQLDQQGLAKKKHEQWLKSIDFKFNNEKKANLQAKKKKGNQQKTQSNAQTIAQQQEQQIQNQLAQQVDQLLKQYQKRFPQYHITGHNNIWILKPAGLSRGRGITCYNNLVQIQDHVKCKQSQWIAQKYIENPLVILKRKFDIRQWVLVTDFNPLTIWMYDECYIRFSAEDYDAKNVHNKFIHLTNNSIGAYHKNFSNSHIKGNMFFQEQFANHLQQKQGYDVFTDKIRPQMKQIVKNSIMCGMEHVQNRKNTHQLFGYDFMVDQNYKAWLIQINSSPSMDYSTHITTKLVKQCLHDIIKVIVDYPAVPKKERKGVDTGKFKKIYKGVQIPDKPISTGLNLCLEGIPMKKPKRNTVKVTNFSLDK